MFGTFHARVTRELFKGWSCVKSSVASTRKVLFFGGWRWEKEMLGVFSSFGSLAIGMWQKFVLVGTVK